MAKTYRQKIGQWGEDLALSWLEERGYECIARHYTCLHGELDLIMQKDGVYTFVEVKTRRNDRFGLAEESMTRRKMAALMRAIDNYLYDHHLEDEEWQLDLLVIEQFDPKKEPEILHFERMGFYED